MPPNGKKAPGKADGKAEEEGRKELVEDKQKILGHLASNDKPRKVGNGAGKDEKPAAAAGTNPLDCTWVFWVLNHQRAVKARWPGGNWAENQVRVFDMTSVEDFWRVHTNVHPPSALANADYSFFRDGVFPAWEDPMVAGGGRWLASFKGGGFGEKLDDMWQEALLLCISEQCEAADTLCGAVVSARPKGCKLAVWMSTSEQTLVMQLGEALRKALGAGLKHAEGGSLHFEDFKKQQYTLELKADDAYQ
jgi:hypothetical protein